MLREFHNVWSQQTRVHTFTVQLFLLLLSSLWFVPFNSVSVCVTCKVHCSSVGASVARNKNKAYQIKIPTTEAS